MSAVATSNKSQSKPEARPLEVLLSLPPDAVLTVEEVRIYSRLKSRQAVYNWLNDSQDPLPASKHGGWRIVKRDLDAYLRRRHNRRSSDGDGYSASDETLRRHLGLLIEIAGAAVAWRRASLVYRGIADQSAAYHVSPDQELFERTFAEVEAAREKVLSLTNTVSDDTLSRLRFMLPSIHSDIALAESKPEEAEGEEGDARVPAASPAA
jgi:hypothetical protein